MPRPIIVLLTLVQQDKYYKCTVFFFHSVTARQLKQGVYELEEWNYDPPVGTVFLQLEFVCHQLLIDGVVARVC